MSYIPNLGPVEPGDLYSSQIPPFSPPPIASGNLFSLTIQAPILVVPNAFLIPLIVSYYIRNSVRYWVEQGGFSLARPRPYMGPGRVFSGNPHPAPVRGPPPLIP